MRRDLCIRAQKALLIQGKNSIIW